MSALFQLQILFSFPFQISVVILLSDLVTSFLPSSSPLHIFHLVRLLPPHVSLFSSPCGVVAQRTPKPRRRSSLPCALFRFYLSYVSGIHEDALCVSMDMRQRDQTDRSKERRGREDKEKVF